MEQSKPKWIKVEKNILKWRKVDKLIIKDVSAFLPPLMCQNPEKIPES